VSEYAKQLQELIGSCDQLTHPSNVGFPKIPHELADAEKAAQVSDMLTSIHLRWHIQQDIKPFKPERTK